MGGRIEKQYEVLEDILAGVTSPRDLPLALLEDITKHFSEERKIGEGGFGTVYKGVLRNEKVAVKKIFVNKYTVDDRLFRREVESLMRINNHRNLVRFLGFCSNTIRSVKEKTGSEETIYPQIMDRLLCFEYISNGSLDKHITDELRGLTWDTRFGIIRGICEGLRYLHVDKSIIHMDLKPANILLDDHMVPKITDFGQSRFTENTHTIGERFITLGYCAPEYWTYGQTTYKADIYSLGVVIVELVTGTKHISDITHVLRRWTHRWNKSATRHQHHQVIKCMEIAVCCIDQEPGNRSSISDIIRDLSETGSTNEPIGQTILGLHDDMLGIEPLELRFSLEDNKQISCSVELTNETSNSIAFNIQKPSKQYNTRPDKGIVLPGCKHDVKITLQQQESAPQVTNADKFVLQSTKVKKGLANEDITDDLFQIKGGKEVVDEVNLMVVYEPEKDQVDISLDRQEKPVSKDIGSSSYNNTRRGLTPPQLLNFVTVESISRNQATGLTSDRTVDLTTGAIGSLLPKLSELLNEFNLETSVRSDVDCVIQDLRLMRADLCSVSEVQRDNNNEHIKLVKLWADEVRELSYVIEDVVDDFLMHVEGSEHATNTGGFMGLLQNMISLFKLGRTSHQIGHAFRDIKNQIQHKSGLKGKYKVNEDFTKRLRGIDGNGDVYGQELKVHSIVGTGGLGKTTLARSVYNHLKGSFRLTSFVPVGRNPNVKKFLYDLLFELDEQRYIDLKPAKLDERQLIDVLKKLLRNNRYLIVIDDMWDKKVWHDFIKFAFVDSKCGSKIIITTRIFEVAAIATDVYKLEPLSHGYAEELFYATLSPEEGRCEYHVTDEIIEKILIKCGGIPLAIITMASLLDSKQREDWPKVYNSVGFGHEVNEDADNTMNILLFSYCDLPRHLRTCLLHLSIFPEDKFIDKRMVIWMWVAEGFVQEEPGRGLFELGERYFNQLINRSMIQMVPEQVSAGFCFHIHDLVLDMICSLSKDENFVAVLETDEQHTFSKDNARRLSVQKRDIENLDTLDCMIQLRSFYATYCHIGVMPSLSSFKALRVLSMDRCSFSEDRPYQLEHIGKLLQLRYLGLDGGPFRKLPEEIGNLVFLQTLILYGTEIKELPHSVGLLRELKCLRSTHSDRLGVPDWMVNMTSLEDLSLRVVKMTPVFAEGLSKLKELRELQIRSYWSHGDNWNRALVKSIGNLLNLQSLRILNFWGFGEQCPLNIWEGFVPPRHLHSMTMILSFPSVPPWMDSTHLPRLSYLELSLLKLEAGCLQILGTLPELHTLKLLTPIGGGRLAVTGSAAFRKLRHLYSTTMLMFQRGVMPRLEYLELLVSVQDMQNANFDCDFTSLGNLPLLQKIRFELQGTGGGADPKYVERMEKEVTNAVNKHPHRRPFLHIDRRFS
ncbi:unnamed protein product [Alopecurus aequalis]